MGGEGCEGFGTVHAMIMQALRGKSQASRVEEAIQANGACRIAWLRMRFARRTWIPQRPTFSRGVGARVPLTGSLGGP